MFDSFFLLCVIQCWASGLLLSAVFCCWWCNRGHFCLRPQRERHLVSVHVSWHSQRPVSALCCSVNIKDWSEVSSSPSSHTTHTPPLHTHTHFSPPQYNCSGTDKSWDNINQTLYNIYRSQATTPECLITQAWTELMAVTCQSPGSPALKHTCSIIYFKGDIDNL